MKCQFVCKNLKHFLFYIFYLRNFYMCFIKLDQIKSSQPIRDSNIYIAKGSPKSIPSLWVHHGRLLVGKLKYVLALDLFVAGWMGSSSRRPQTDGLGDLWNRATQMMVEISFVASRLYSMCSFSPRTTNSETCVCANIYWGRMWVRRLFYVAFAVLKRAILLLRGERSKSTQWIVVDVGRTGVGLLFAFLPFCGTWEDLLLAAPTSRGRKWIYVYHICGGEISLPHMNLG